MIFVSPCKVLDSIYGSCQKKSIACQALSPPRCLPDWRAGQPALESASAGTMKSAAGTCGARKAWRRSCGGGCEAESRGIWRVGSRVTRCTCSRDPGRHLCRFAPDKQLTRSVRRSGLTWRDPAPPVSAHRLLSPVSVHHKHQGHPSMASTESRPTKAQASWLYKSLGWLFTGARFLFLVVLLGWATLAIYYSNLPGQGSWGQIFILDKIE